MGERGRWAEGPVAPQRVARWAARAVLGGAVLGIACCVVLMTVDVQAQPAPVPTPWDTPDAGAEPSPSPSPSPSPPSSPPVKTPWDEPDASAAAEPDASAEPEPEPEPAAPPPPPKDPAREEAKRLFLQGNELLKAGDHERAFDYYLRSRGLRPSISNTTNAAVCLAHLGRHDEALDLYEKLLTEFGPKLLPAERTGIARAMTRLRGLVGSIDVQANVEGALVIDGRARGQLPLTAPVRALPGKHTVYVVKDGYQSFEATVTVQVGQVLRVDARLVPVTAGGRLRVDDPALAGAELFIDGALVGTVPWEGSLGAGHHYFVVRKGELGSAPRAVVVIRGRSVPGAAALLPLGPELRIAIKPASAALRIDDVPVAKGLWQGRLPIGAHQIVVLEEGYFGDERTLAVSPQTQGTLQIVLKVDEEHPRWATSEQGHAWLDLIGGLALAPSFGSGAEQSCDDHSCARNPTAVGVLAGARAGWEFPMGVSIEIAGGYLAAWKTVERTIELPAQSPSSPVLRYSLTDELRFSGAFAGAGVAFRRVFDDWFELRGDVVVGAHFASTRDTVTGIVSDGSATAPVEIEGSGEGVSSANLFVMPGLQAGVRTGGFGVGLGLLVPIFTIPGPELGLGQVWVPPEHCPGSAAGCAKGTAIVNEDIAYDTFVMLVPMISAGYLF